MSTAAPPLEREIRKRFHQSNADGNAHRGFRGGSNLSGGQRQRLLLARALILKPRILILDEATSALDNRTQAAVTENLDRLRVTRIIAAHRLSTIRNADRVYVIEGGRVVQEGTFEALSAEEGLFRRLMTRQTV